MLENMIGAVGREICADRLKRALKDAWIAEVVATRKATRIGQTRTWLGPLRGR